MKRYFTSDWHLNEDRIGINGKPNLFYRPFTDVYKQNRTILLNLKDSNFRNGDELIHLGDVEYKLDEESPWHLSYLRHVFPHSKFTLIKGNYDIDKLDYLSKYFDEMVDDKTIEIKGREYYLNHYPFNCVEHKRSLTGHIHSLWKVQKLSNGASMINVGVDAWHFKPISEDEIDFCMNAIEHHYDVNVFPCLTENN